MALTDYHRSVGDWRDQLRRNSRRTKMVIITFILIYTAVGLVADLLILQSTQQGMSLGQAFFLLVSFRAIPYATLIMAAVAAVSLFITYAMYDKIMLMGTDSREITPESAQNLQEKQLYNVVDEMRVAAGLKYMPKVYLIEANYMNAFASGYSEKSAMVAITRGLMEKLNRAEMQAVMAHELSHIRHQDTKLTLTVAILSNILLIVIDILFYSVVYKRDRDQDGRLVLVIVVLRYILPLITIILALFLSRTREYMADSGAVELMRDNEPMARALLKIAEDNEAHADEYTKAYGDTPHEQLRQSSYLFDPSAIDPVKSLTNLFSTHPDIDKRLRALGFRKSTVNNA